MDVGRILVLFLVFASVEVLGRKKGRKNKRKWLRRFPRPYRWMHYNSNYDPTIEGNGCVDVRPLCPRWARFPGYCGYARGYMIRHCKKSCNLCKAEDDVSIGKTSGVDNSYVNDVCEDRLEDCQTYIKTQSQCDLFSGMMKKYCRKTCGFCCRDILTDCSLFIKRPSQCRGLNGFFRKYCPNTCQMCGFLLPTKKPGCQDELDDCSSFTIEECQIHKSFGNKYCARTCGFCEDLGYSPQGTTPQVVQRQHTYNPTNIEDEVSPTDSTSRVFEDDVNTRETTRDTSQQGTFPALATTSPAVAATSPAESGISLEPTGIPDATTLADLKTDESAATDLKTEIPQTTASSITTKPINIEQTTGRTRDEDSTSASSASTNSVEGNTATSSTTADIETESSAQTTPFTTESTEASASKSTTSISSPKTTAAQVLGKTTTDAVSTVSIATRTLSKTDTGFPTTNKEIVSESPSSAPVSSPKTVTSGFTSDAESARTPVTTRIPEETATEQTNTVNLTSGTEEESIEETTASSILDNIPTTPDTERITYNLNTDPTSYRLRVTTGISSTARPDIRNSSPPSGAKEKPVEEGTDSSILDNIPTTTDIERMTYNLNTDPTTSRLRVTTGISSTARPDIYNPSPSTVEPVSEVFSQNTESTDKPNITTSSESQALSTSTPVVTSVKVAEAQTSVKPSITEASVVTESQVIVDGSGQDVPTTELLGNREQNIDAVGPTVQVPTSQRSPLRTKTKKSACVDKIKECANYVSENINYCKYHVHFMHEFCSKSCGFCGHDKAFVPDCEDERKQKCRHFSRYVGYCTINEEYMRRRCPKSCGFCGVAPGSAPMDKTFVRSDQKYDFSITTQWDGTPIKHAPIKFKLSAEDNTNVRLEVRGPFFNQPGPPPCAAGQPCWQLWNYEVAEMFFLGEKEKYLELEVSPHGPHLLLLLDGVRKPFKTKLPMRYSANIDLSSMTWNGTAIIPLDYFPPGMRKINAYAIHGPDNNKIYESLYPAKNTPYPDFHRLDFFKDFDFKSMFPSGWHQPISPLWLRSK